jgi:hypothetical protein
MKFGWKQIHEDDDALFWEGTYRAKVPGGWLVRHESAYNYMSDEDDFVHRTHVMNFVPDPNHEWTLD